MSTTYQIVKKALTKATNKQVRTALTYINSGRIIFCGPKTNASWEFVSEDGKLG